MTFFLPLYSVLLIYKIWRFLSNRDKKKKVNIVNIILLCVCVRFIQCIAYLNSVRFIKKKKKCLFLLSSLNNNNLYL